MLDSPSLHCLFTTTWPSLPHSFHSNSLLLPTPRNSKSTKFHSPHFTSSLVHAPGRTSFPVLALQKSEKGSISLNEQGDSDIEFDELFDEEDDFEDEYEAEMLLPLKNTREGRPRGFGEGKEYNTSIEDELLQEIEKSKAVQAANISKLKLRNQSSSEPNYGKNVAQIVAPEIVSTGFRVRIVNLPKKKNIQRDLMVAFKEFPGIINITPAVLGSKKTRDPICKGFAFVDFKSKGDAISFLQAFSGQHLTFGRVQKQIKCEMVDRQTSSSSLEISVGSSTNHPRLNILEEEAHQQVADLDMDLAAQVVRTRVENVEENLASDSELHSDDEDGNGAESRSDSKIRSASEKELEIFREVGEILPQGTEEVGREILSIKGKTKVSKKKQPKEKREKKSSIGIPGSAKRLRIKEKAILSDVYSRYGKKSALVSKEGN